MKSPSPILEVRGVTKSFGAVDVLQGIDFSVEAVLLPHSLVTTARASQP